MSTEKEKKNTKIEKDSRLEEKWECLVRMLEKLDSCLIAYSGGVDSSLLLSAAREVLGGRAEAITIKPPYFPSREGGEAHSFALELGLEPIVVEMELPDELKTNPPERCYLCKKRMFSLVEEKAGERGNSEILDGSNADDLEAYRPGIRALEEKKVRSPLAECGIRKEDVRSLARRKGLSTAEKPAYSCLLTRLPHETDVDLALLEKVEKAEEVVAEEGLLSVRVRTHPLETGVLARIEIPPAERESFALADRMDRVDESLRNLGYRYVSLDLAGYRSGSMDPLPYSQLRAENPGTGRRE